MPAVPLRVDAETAAFLHEAYHKITTGFGNDHYGLYDYVRAVTGKFAHFDSFYIGLLHGTNRVRFPYGFEGGRFDDPVSHTFGPNSPTAWLLRNRQIYRFGYDNGAVLQAGVAFGDLGRPSADAITAPLFRFEGTTRGRIFGMVSMHSYRAGAFDDNAVRAFGWLADLVARVLTREAEDADALRLLPAGGDATPQALTSDHVVEYLASRVAALREIALEDTEQKDASPSAPHDRLKRIVRACEQIQSELIEMTLRTDDGPERRFLSLTPAEQRLALLLVDGLNNQRLAEELGVSQNTVKSHLKAICRKYGMDHRSRIADDIRRHLAR
ncbi:LuxR C-terminal-related transcriptional regulator [Streptomyces sp. QTS52]